MTRSAHTRRTRTIPSTSIIPSFCTIYRSILREKLSQVWFLEYNVFFISEKGKRGNLSLPESFEMSQRTYLLAIMYVRYAENVPTALISLSASYRYIYMRCHHGWVPSSSAACRPTVRAEKQHERPLDTSII